MSAVRRDLIRFTALAMSITITLALFGTALGAVPDITKEEQALLPNYCKYVQLTKGYGSEQSKRWAAVYGEAFIHLHHYCYALVYLMKAVQYSTPPEMRRFYLSTAFSEIQYVVERIPDDHMLRPELLTKQAMILRRLNKPKEAVDLLNQVVQLDPKYWRAYYELAESYVALKDKKKAREVLEEGLGQVPDARLLTATLKDLEGESRANK